MKKKRFAPMLLLPYIYLIPAGMLIVLALIPFLPGLIYPYMLLMFLIFFMPVIVIFSLNAAAVKLIKKYKIRYRKKSMIIFLIASAVSAVSDLIVPYCSMNVRFTYKEIALYDKYVFLCLMFPLAAIVISALIFRLAAEQKKEWIVLTLANPNWLYLFFLIWWFIGGPTVWVLY